MDGLPFRAYDCHRQVWNTPDEDVTQNLFLKKISITNYHPRLLTPKKARIKPQGAHKIVPAKNARFECKNKD